MNFKYFAWPLKLTMIKFEIIWNSNLKACHNVEEWLEINWLCVVLESWIKSNATTEIWCLASRDVVVDTIETDFQIVTAPPQTLQIIVCGRNENSSCGEKKIHRHPIVLQIIVSTNWPKNYTIITSKMLWMMIRVDVEIALVLDFSMTVWLLSKYLVHVLVN